MSQKIIITTCPWKDYKKNKWMLSTFMSIQLDAGKDAKLSAFPDIMNWIERLQQASFFVQWNNDQPKEIKVQKDKWDADLYKKLFEGNINVRSFSTPDISKLVLKSYPVLHITDFIFNTYKDVGTLRPDVLPTTRFFADDYKKLNILSQVQLKQTQPMMNIRVEVAAKDFLSGRNEGMQAARQQLSRSRAIPYSRTANTNMDFGQFQNFHIQPQAGSTKTLAPLNIPKPDFEYHDILTILTSYPPIMKKLGLVLDFELPALPPAANGTVRILPANLSFENDVTVSCPATAFQFTGKGFYAASKNDSFIDKGMLKINTDDFTVVQIDTDGAAMKLSNQADAINYRIARNLAVQSNLTLQGLKLNANRQADNAGTTDKQQEDTNNDEALPSLRSAGIGVVKNGLAQNLMTKFVRVDNLYKTLINPKFSINSVSLYNSKPKEGNAAVSMKDLTIKKEMISKAVIQPALIPVATETLYADDIVFGYRLDVAMEDKPNNWYSLHKRKNTYSFSPVGQNQQPVSLLPEDEIDEGAIHLALTKDENDKEQDQKVNEVIVRWEGWSLAVPRLGKGLNNEGTEISSDEDERKKYLLDKDIPFRLQVNTRPAPKSLPMLRFGRTYKIKVRTVDITGNGLPVDVLPENESQSIKSGIKYLRYEPLPAPVLLEGDEVVSGDKSKMRSRDGESVQHMVIRSNYNVDAKQYEQNNPTPVPGTTLIYLHESVRHLKAPKTSQQMAEVHGMFDEAFADPMKAKEAYSFIKSRDKEVKNDGKTKAEVIPVTTKQVDIDYLADPMAAGVIFTLKSDVTFETQWKKGDSRKFSFYFDEEVNDKNANSVYSKEQWKTPRSLRIRLFEGKGEPSWNASERVFSVPLPKSAQIEINYACFWRPDDLDRFSGLQKKIVGNDTNSDVARYARRGLHWMFSPWRTIRLVHAVQQPLEKPEFDKKITRLLKNYGDTYVTIATKISVHGSSTDKVDVEAGWKEWVDDLNDTKPKQLTLKTHVQSIPVSYKSKELDLMNATRTMMMVPAGTLPDLVHSFNDTKHRMVDYTPVATTRYREYFTGIIEAAKSKGKEIPLTQSGDTVQWNILSSARPVLPVIDYVLPSFNWIKTEKGNNLAHLRTANIRVYMKRPWYSSGDNERLAVILPPKGTDPAKNPVYAKNCTVWGKDPIYTAQNLNNSNYPQIDHFPLGIENSDPKIANEEEAMKAPLIYDSCYLPGESSAKVSVAAYKVLFDENKQLHYADIPVFIGFAYSPFVKLALARYQRHSLRTTDSDCCLSNIVYSDWMQVLPSRATTVNFEGKKNLFTVSLKGTAPYMTNPDNLTTGADNARVKIVVTVESALFPKSEEAFISINDRTTKTYITSKETILNFRQIKNGQIDYSEKIEIPSEWTGKPFRIVIREYELHESDPLRTMQNNLSGMAVIRDLAERLVYMDAFEVNGSV